MRPEKAFGVPIPYALPLDELRRHLEIAGPTAWAACLALAERPEPEALELLVELTSRPEWQYRNLAIQGLGAHPLGAQAEGAVRKGLSDAVSQVARTSCDSAARLKLEAARPAIVALLDSPDEQLRFHALRAVKALWTGEEFGRVWDVLKKDKAEFVRQEAAVVLRETATKKTWRTLFNRWKREAVPRHRAWACEMLSAFGDDDDLPELQRLSRDSSKHVREAAERAAYERGVSY